MSSKTALYPAPRTLCICLSAFVILSSCVLPPPAPKRTQLQIRQMQMRTYDKPPGGTIRVMKALINVLQDEGFIIRNADRELGFITGTREVDVQDPWESLFAELGSSAQPARYSKNSIVECSANVSEFGQEVRVRAIFQVKVLDNLGGTVSVKQIDDPGYYQEFFSKVDKGIFIERQNL